MNRLGIPLLVSAAQLGAAAFALSRPDPRSALAFLGGGWPTTEETLAALEILVWGIVLVAVGWSMATLARELASRVVKDRRVTQAAGRIGNRRDVAVLGTGLLILAAGAAHHATYQLGMSGGSVQEAKGFLGR